jgi:predicted DNA-binding WGR domain protein
VYLQNVQPFLFPKGMARFYEEQEAQKQRIQRYGHMGMTGQDTSKEDSAEERKRKFSSSLHAPAKITTNSPFNVADWIKV